MPARIPSALTLSLVAACLTAGVARAQEPSPVIPSAEARSGLFTRHVPIIPRLPHDPKRDIWENGRWADEHESTYINSPCNGGLYGRCKWPGTCTACFSPYFRGSPGASTLNAPTCPPPHSRLIGNFVHPFKPVSYYYNGGCYVPIYDLDPQVPGPGPFPWPRLYCRKPLGG